MMKKLLVLMLVLSVASVANAALLISVDGIVDPEDTTIELLPTDYLTIDIWGDGLTPPQQALYLFSIKESCDCILDSTNGVILYPGNLSELEPGIEDDFVWIDESNYPRPCSVVFIVLADSTPPPNTPPLTGKLVDLITVHCAAGEGDCVLYLTDADDPTIVYDTQVIHQIPEPASMLLLGLGGLLLRRRK